ncbi:MAG: hypothetical protein COV47_05485 [Candidatus Diapherotrites archaeon CG11_big_fil_rev_8_21_14_0_20_37_9]|nr:MAG: hypothetical protein COV47_05485 [Candidatus Diapherotrites archaeon CG11_big_fil_rev_8_21_14_0_20_37_9]
MEIRHIFSSYLKNFSTVLAFALLFVFVLPFVWLQNSFVSSGTIFLDYGFIKAPILDSLLLLLLVLGFLFIYSVLVCLLIFAVRKDLGKVKTNYYLREKIHKFAIKYFIFLSVFTVGGTIIASFLLDFGVPVELVNILLIIVSLSFLFLPQTIVVDEESLRSSILTNWDFLLKNIPLVLGIFAVGSLVVFGLLLVEFVIDFFFFVGNFFSLFFSLVVFVPVLEIIKTKMYLERFDIVRKYSLQD